MKWFDQKHEYGETNLNNRIAQEAEKSQYSCVISETFLTHTLQTTINTFNAGGEIVGELNHLVSCPTQENTSQFTFHG